MDKEKEIQEMARVLCGSFVERSPQIGKVKDCVTNGDCGLNKGLCCFRDDAAVLYAAGYRKADEVRKETAKEIFLELSEDENICGGYGSNYDISNHAKKYGVDIYGVEVEE